MDIKKIAFAAIISVGLVACSNETTNESGENEAENIESIEKTYAVDVENSKVDWEGNMMNMYSHSGILKFSEGSVTITDGNVSGGSFAIDWNTLDATDSNYSEDKPKEYLIGHLKSADFFAADSLGAATFTITGMEGEDVTGDLTIRGITNSEKITGVTVTEMESGLAATGELVFDRQKYEVSYAVAMEDMVISDDITLNITLIAK